MESVKTFIKFIAVPNTKEIGLVIAEDAAELGDFEKTLKKNGFSEVGNAKALFAGIAQGGKFYSVIGGDLPKDLYDMLAQYETGQVELFNQSDMTSDAITPDYKNLSVMFLVAEKTFKGLPGAQREMLLSIGPVYRS